MEINDNYILKRISPQLLVTDLERAITFYIQKLGFEIDFRYEDFYCGIIKDGHSIHLKWCDVLPRGRTEKRENEHIDLMFAVDDIEDLYNNLERIGVGITQPLRQMPYGKEFYIADPDGYIIAFLN